MPSFNDMHYHAIRQQVRRVVMALGEDRTDKGLTAFEDGHSNWSDCFFARALAGEVNLNVEGERGVARVLGLTRKDGGLNLIPVRIVYHAFDSASRMVTRSEMCQIITDIRDETRPDEVMRLLRSIDFTGVEEKPVEFAGATCAS